MITFWNTPQTLIQGIQRFKFKGAVKEVILTFLNTCYVTKCFTHSYFLQHLIRIIISSIP